MEDRPGALRPLLSELSGEVPMDVRRDDVAVEQRSVVLIGGRYWLVDCVEQARVQTQPALYRLTLRQPAGRQESGPFGGSVRLPTPSRAHPMTIFLELFPIWALSEGSIWLAVLFERRQRAPAARLRRVTASAPDSDR